MRISAKRISEWAGEHGAQALLPLLVRRLICASGEIRRTAFPGGESIVRGGWDGQLEFEGECAWAPEGVSCWELSCDKRPKTKAERDFDKRTNQTPADARRSLTYVCVTPQRWDDKEEWRREKQALGMWRQVVAFDADDLEQWIEQSPGVAVWFGEQIGVIGHGVRSPEQCWRDWSQQPSPAISVDAILASRDAERKAFLEAIQLARKGKRILTIRADSTEEALAFACAVLIANSDSDESLLANAIVVNDELGWRFVEANDEVRLAIAASPEIAAKRPMLDRIVVVSVQASGAADQKLDQKHVIQLPRPIRSEFAEALESMGIDRIEADRLARASGRSWSIYRRLKATSPAIIRPLWMDDEASRALPTMCLVGGWSSVSVTDCQFVEQIELRAVDEFEADLTRLAGMDDAPVFRVGQSWRVKSPVELLLYVIGERITARHLDRFFQETTSLLQRMDPSLELPAEERWSAAIHNKIKTESDLLRRSLADALARLAVIGHEVSGLRDAHVQSRVRRCVADLLHRANATRWLSLSDVLPLLAEADPEAFLSAVEWSVFQVEPPISKLFGDSTSDLFMGRRYYPSLLWALETIAWDAAHLLRVSLLLTKLQPFKEIAKDNTTNSPLGSLISLFLDWLPQTSATLEQRQQTLRRLVELDPTYAWKVVEAMVIHRPTHASENSRPRWRADGLGCGRGVSGLEVAEMHHSASEVLVQLACVKEEHLIEAVRNAGRLTILLQRQLFDEVASICGSSTDDEQRARLRDAVRAFLNRQRSKDSPKSKDVKAIIEFAETMFWQLAPTDPVVRERWKFGELRLQFPEGRVANAREWLPRSDAARIESMRELLGEGGVASAVEMVGVADAPWLVGVAFADADASDEQIRTWVHGLIVNGDWPGPAGVAVQGLMHRLDRARGAALEQWAKEQAAKGVMSAEQVALFLIVCPFDRVTWTIVDDLGSDVGQTYWSRVTGHIHDGSESDVAFAMQCFLDMDRPRSAFQCAQFVLERAPVDLLIDALRGFVAGREPEGPEPDAYVIDLAFAEFDRRGSAPENDMISLEFGLYPALRGGERGPRTLLSRLRADPSLFAELICLAYRGDSGGSGDLKNVTKPTRQHAWDVLHDFTSIPGVDSDGAVDVEVMRSWFEGVQSICQGQGRGEVADVILGELLANAPADSDGYWPCAAVAQLFEEIWTDSLSDGFECGVRNKHGESWRGFHEGGGREQTLAERFSKFAESASTTFPRVATSLRSISESFVRDAEDADRRAAYRREGD